MLQIFQGMHKYHSGHHEGEFCFGPPFYVNYYIARPMHLAGLSTQSSHGGNELSIDSRDVDSPNPGLKLAEAFQSRPKHAATQLKEVPKARVSFASARTTGTPKPFVPLDPASIRRGFQVGGANSKTEDLKKGTSQYILPMDKTIHFGR